MNDVRFDFLVTELDNMFDAGDGGQRSMAYRMFMLWERELKEDSLLGMQRMLKAQECAEKIINKRYEEK